MLNNLSIGKKLTVLLFVFIAGYAIFGLISFSTLNTLSINGNLHKQIIMSKDLIADVLPPPGYIIESYLDILQLVDESESAQMDYFYAELKRLQADYEERHKFWIHEPLLEAGALKDAMLTGAYEPAVKFYEIVFNRFIPALQRGDREQARELAHGELKTLYSIHRQSIDKVVQGATEKYEKTEAIAGITVQRDTKALFIFAFAIIAVAAAIVFFIIKSITKPINMVVDALKDIAEGEGDLTRTINVHSKGEIGALALNFNNLMETMRVPIAETKHVINNLTAAAEELSKISNELTLASEKTVKYADSTTSRTGRMSENINTMASGTEQASVNAGEVAGAAEQMSVNMNTIAAAVEQMSASIKEIANNTSEVNHIATDATTKSAEATSVMSKLGAAAKEIGQVTDVIKKIADKTNLLALNATIEAASAGEAGKGFAVVAGEIKELANQSANSADDIARRIESIQTETSDAVRVINDVSKIIENINHSVETISTHIDQQNKTSNEIASNVAQANTGAKRVAGSIGEVAKGANDVSRNAGDAARHVSQVAKEISTMSDEANKSNQSASKLKSSASNLIAMADDLRNVMGKFKV